MKITLVLRKSTEDFKSIEIVFGVLSEKINFQIKNLPNESKGLFKRILNILFVSRMNYDILHISGHDHYLLWFPFKKSILTIHDVEALRRKNGLKKHLFKWLWFDIPIKNVTAITTISEFTKQELKALGRYKTPIFVIPNPITIDVEYAPKFDFSAELKILHIGTKKNKNLLRLVNAIHGIKCELTIIGPLTQEQEQHLKEGQVNYRNLKNIDKIELKNEYYKCDLLAFVSTYEGFGLPILEAQAMGRVVVTSNVASMPEVAGAGALLVDPFSEESIRMGIQQLTKDSELRRQLIEKGQDNLRRFQTQKIAQEYNKVYNQVKNGF